MEFEKELFIDYTPFRYTIILQVLVQGLLLLLVLVQIQGLPFHRV